MVKKRGREKGVERDSKRGGGGDGCAATCESNATTNLEQGVPTQRCVCGEERSVQS